MNELYRISQIASLFGVSCDTLRLYEKMGFLNPAFTDSDTKYRYYGVNEILQLDYILQLKGVGLSLSEIRKVVDKGLNLSEKRQLLEQQYDNLSKLLSVYDSLMHTSEYEIELKTYPKHYIVSESAKVDKWEKLIEVYKALTCRIIDNNLTYKRYANAYATFEGEFSFDNFSCTACLEVEPSSCQCVSVIAEKNFITLRHKGDYETLNTAYDKLYSYATEHNIRLLPYNIERYIVAYDNSPMSSKYITEINLPIDN